MARDDKAVVWAAFAYQAKIIQKRHRNDWTERFRGDAPVEIERIDEGDAPLAIRLTRQVDGKAATRTEPAVEAREVVTDIRWDGERFMRPLLGPSGEPMSLADFARAMAGEGMRQGPHADVAWAGNPLLTYVKRDKVMEAQTVFSLGTREQRADELRSWISDDKADRQAELQARAAGVVVVGDAVHRFCAEPTWELDLGYSTKLAVQHGRPKPEASKVVFRIDRLDEAMALVGMLNAEDKVRVSTRVDVVIPDSLAQDTLAINTESLLTKVSQSLGKMAVQTETGEAARAWADMRDAGVAWRAGDPDALQAAYGALRRMVESDWTKSPHAEPYDRPSPDIGKPLLMAFEEFERPRMDDGLALSELAPAP